MPSTRPHSRMGSQGSKLACLIGLHKRRSSMWTSSMPRTRARPWRRRADGLRTRRNGRMGITSGSGRRRRRTAELHTVRLPASAAGMAWTVRLGRRGRRANRARLGLRGRRDRKGRKVNRAKPALRDRRGRRAYRVRRARRGRRDRGAWALLLLRSITR